VFDVNARPWIDLTGGDAEDIAATIRARFATRRSMSPPSRPTNRRPSRSAPTVPSMFGADSASKGRAARSSRRSTASRCADAERVRTSPTATTVIDWSGSGG